MKEEPQSEKGLTYDVLINTRPVVYQFLYFLYSTTLLSV